MNKGINYMIVYNNIDCDIKYDKQYIKYNLIYRSLS